FQMKRSERRFQNVFQTSIRDEISVLNYLNGSNNVARALEMSYNEQDLQEHLMEVEGALISLRPKSGHITAIIGGSGFRSDNQQIRPFQAYRQPGSSFKPLVYASAIDYFGKHPDEEEKVTASTLFLDSPMNYLSEDGDEWEPSNYSESYAGFIRLRSALETSRNMVALRVLDQVGLSKVLPTLYALLGIQDREIPRNISVALGTFEVTPLEIARAYAVFASGGKEVHPICILKITDSKGALIKDYETENLQKERKQIISPEASYIITSMMKGVITRGTGTAVKHSGLGGSVVGKTGTTNNFRDAWFVGYTPELVSSLWMGYDLGTMSLGKGMAGGIITAPVWGRYMKKALEGEKRGKFSFGGNLNIVKKKICKFSGKQFGSKCQKSYYEFYIKGTEPEICKDHSMIFFPGMNDPDEHLSKKKKE
ncbi:MAG: carboxypeptidase, partial [Leptospiraceae bacterium]|nr:carboxypeptidase [Leptospiraceae bacterium]